MENISGHRDHRSRDHDQLITIIPESQSRAACEQAEKLASEGAQKEKVDRIATQQNHADGLQLSPFSTTSAANESQIKPKLQDLVALNQHRNIKSQQKRGIPCTSAQQRLRLLGQLERGHRKTA
ncbi:MAG: hypothetical protein DMG70_33415 [Acidobacteria bacterium]|nr:MAG: hypothetical protein DMG70_33415 [Acidobacteriota bacterium]